MVEEQPVPRHETASEHQPSQEVEQHQEEQQKPHKRENVYDYHNSTIQQDKEAALEVEKHLDDTRRRNEQRHPKKPSEMSEQDQREDSAARLVQGGYRAHSNRRSKKGMNLTNSDRWSDGLRLKKIKDAGNEQDTGKNDSNSRWKRGGLYAQKISEGSKSPKGGDEGTPEMTEEEEMNALGKNEKERQKIKEERQASKQMEAQYWLEIVDKKHRYGTNLKWYHKHWNEECDTDENFFYWLDEGGGKDLELQQCPRSRLDKERIAYLNAQQRQNYKVIVNEQGRLVWARNGKPLHTTKYHRDAGGDVGIVEMTEDEVKEREAKAKAKKKAKAQNGGESPPSSSSSSSSSDEEEDEEEGREGVKGYEDKGGTAMQGKGVKQVKARLDYYLSPRAVMDRLLRDTINKNTWLYVADMNNDLYVGIKKTGGFQHSSLLGGSRVTSAGLIKANEGLLTSLSPLSGHYRAGTMHFKSFVRSLEEKNCDMSSLSVSKSLVTIGGIEKYGKFTKKKKELKEKVKVTLGLAKPEKEEKEERDQQDIEKIKSDEHQAGDAGEEDELEEDEDSFQSPLPSEGKKVEEMTEDERMERGIALVERAMERALTDRRARGKRVAEDASQEEKPVEPMAEPKQ